MHVPDDFVLGAATAAYQIEGAATEDGRGPSIWDTFSHVPGTILDDDTGDTAADHYHRLEPDLDLMADLGLDAYRFSISWPRVLPRGRGQVNRAGLDFYSRLVDGLLERGIAPVATLYHWDLPQALQDTGGWLDRSTAAVFADYAHVVGTALGDRVDTWTTLNEPWCSAYLGYGSGGHAPGLTGREDPLVAAHHLSLAHGSAIAALKPVVRPDAKFSVTLNFHVFTPDGPTGPAAVEKVDALANDTFLVPMVEGRLSERLVRVTEDVTDWAFVHDGDLATIAQPLSNLGVNYYSSNAVRMWDGRGERELADGHRRGATSAWPGAEDVDFLAMPGPHTAMGWNIDPDALGSLLRGLSVRYPDLPLVITENGAAFDDEVAPDGAIHDDARIDYVRRHLAAALDARADGVDLRGYFVWSLLDNFEWRYGYARRFGIVRVEYDTLERTPKDSALWYRDVIATRTF
ncbi:beta-glucosidase [Flavimobilis sp. GY10621]|uniref:Beta-glucosidase n=1 Tax=Flavimobilis rhizosphaerae TaxID=2775421 RepID=A0ABR9DSB7_9MICO|nr:GH1 family beta-glucosidase [Flavimobilis rhizosphaerae]MBD9699222.1 beta-glucosidase [Flavimobilis rhizosphaerae]